MPTNPKSDPFRLAKRIVARAARDPLCVFSVAAAVLWGGSWATSTDWRTSHPRTLSDRQLMKHFKNANRGLYGTKPHYQKIDDPMAGTIR